MLQAPGTLSGMEFLWITDALGHYCDKNKEEWSQRLHGPEHVHLWDTIKSGAWDVTLYAVT